jgi:predicted DNA-binding transcriptional regulator AlpA
MSAFPKPRRAGNRHAGFDERDVETEPWSGS